MLAEKYGANEDLYESMAAVMNARAASGIYLNRNEEQALLAALRYAALKVLLSGYGLVSADGLQDGYAFLAQAMNPFWLKRWPTLTFDDAAVTLTNLLSPRQMLFVLSRFAREIGEQKIASLAEHAALTGESVVVFGDEDVPVSRSYGQDVFDFGPPSNEPNRSILEYVERLSRGEHIDPGPRSPVLIGWNMLAIRARSRLPSDSTAKLLRSATPTEWISIVRGSAR